MGLYVEPHIPADKLQNALDDYAPNIDGREVVVMYDATLFGSGKDGALFLRDRLVFQNNNLEPAHEVRYADIVEVGQSKKLLGGKRVALTVNRGRATITLEIDFSGKPKATPFVVRFLDSAFLRAVEEDDEPGGSSEEAAAENEPTAGSDRRAVEEALVELVRQGKLTRSDYQEMMRILSR